MTVVCDTSPICYLILVNQIDLLPELFGQVTIPQAVRDELSAEGELVGLWISQPPDWLNIQSVITEADAALERLDLGEREAILLAENLGAELIVLDDLDARRIATERGLTVTGLLGVLYEGGIRGAIDFPNTIELLQQTTFRASAALIQQFLDRYRRHIEIS